MNWNDQTKEQKRYALNKLAADGSALERGYKVCIVNQSDLSHEDYTHKIFCVTGFRPINESLCTDDSLVVELQSEKMGGLSCYAWRLHIMEDEESCNNCPARFKCWTG